MFVLVSTKKDLEFLSSNMFLTLTDMKFHVFSHYKMSIIGEISKILHETHWDKPDD